MRIILQRVRLPKVGIARRIVRSTLFRSLCLGVLLVFTAAVVLTAREYRRFAAMVDIRLKNQGVQRAARIYAASGQLVTNLDGASRRKKRVVAFTDIPGILVEAVTSGEDRGFFSHHGFAPSRIVGAFISNLDEGNRLQGGSTITQQLARNIFLSAEPTWRRKFSEVLIAVILELRLTKEEIFTMYANEVYLGQHGSFSVHGFGEGTLALFGKDLQALTLPEAATLAGIIPAPNAFSPSKHPGRAIARRNLVLRTMRQRGVIGEKDYDQAKNSKLEIVAETVDSTDAPYFVDYVREQLLEHYSEEDLLHGGLDVYTTLDAELQKTAVDAVTQGLAQVQSQLVLRNKNRKGSDAGLTPSPQAALIALDPHTGEIKAIVGGTDYATSQYNRITHAFRQPGSVFKPFVYAAALETAYDRRSLDSEDHANSHPSLEDPIITAVTTIMDSPKSFLAGDVLYEPNNYKREYHGVVTVRTALMRSLNLPTVRVAERIGFDRVASLARRMGLNAKIKGYPSVALGAFEVTPMELAGAYTAFANGGVRVDPHVLLRVASTSASEPLVVEPKTRQVLKPEIAYLMTHLMEAVINAGTGAGVRARGFTLPAAGKTGTSRDGWFVGYTRDLLVIVWVGFDDNRDLNLEGARSALPIWTEFMLHAYQIHPVKDKERMSFKPPPGIDIVNIDSVTLMLPTPKSGKTFEEAFVSGTAPAEPCSN